MGSKAKDILRIALEKILEEHDIKIESIHVNWEDDQGLVATHKCKVRGIEAEVVLK